MYQPEDDDDEECDSEYDFDDEVSDVVVLDTSRFLEREDKARQDRRGRGDSVNPWDDVSLNEDDEGEIIRRRHFEKNGKKRADNRRASTDVAPLQVDPADEFAYLHRNMKPDFKSMHVDRQIKRCMKLYGFPVRRSDRKAELVEFLLKEWEKFTQKPTASKSTVAVKYPVSMG